MGAFLLGHAVRPTVHYFYLFLWPKKMTYRTLSYVWEMDTYFSLKMEHINQKLDWKNKQTFKDSSIQPYILQLL